MQLINHYFRDLSKDQLTQLIALQALYADWNDKINVISRKDLENFYERHVLHSLSIGRFIQFLPGTKVMDLGTGGGFPGIPLAIYFPEVAFTLVDSIGKKIKVVEEVVQSLGLKNVKPIWGRAEEIKGQFDFVVTRAVAPMEDLQRWVERKITRKSNHAMPNGIIALKGGDLKEELKSYRKKAIVTELSTYFKEEFFETKKLVYLPI